MRYIIGATYCILLRNGAAWRGVSALLRFAFLLRQGGLKTLFSYVKLRVSTIVLLTDGGMMIPP
jgi:hypothetical protein